MLYSSSWNWNKLADEQPLPEPPVRHALCSSTRLQILFSPAPSSGQDADHGQSTSLWPLSRAEQKADYSDLEEERFPLTYGSWTLDKSSPGWDVPWTICPSFLSYQYHVLQYAGQFISCVWTCWSKCSPIFQEHFIHCFQIAKYFFLIPWQVEIYSTGWKCLPYFGLILAFRGRDPFTCRWR